MKTPFREMIRTQIADQHLQQALDGNASRRVRARINALSSLPDWRERRIKAHALRAQGIDHLEEYLAKFEDRLQANGIQVHRASTAAEAVRLVLEIAGASGNGNPARPLLFAKSKSMLSEEIGLNSALEAAGHRVVETDLGEYIVQLRGERPAHIITPAVHLRRQDIGQLFHEKLGIPYSEDITALTDAARARLREVFLTADVGLTGVNFGVAETGSLVLVTNEGNARMCSSLPPVHIALMGLERLLPGLDDLALCLSLLPRYATGQKLTAYTQLIQRPEGGQSKHLILVDNGRLRLRNSPLRESLYCIRCGSCLNACPVFREIGGHGYLGANGQTAVYPGPIGAVISPGLLGENFAGLAQASTLCGACKDACPVDIDLPKLLLRVRAGEYPRTSTLPDQPHGFAAQPDFLQQGLAAYSRLSAHPRWFALAQKLAGLLSLPLPAFFPLPAGTGWGFSKDLPKPAARPFRERFRPISLPGGMEPGQPVPALPAASPPEIQAGETAAFDPVEAFSKELAAIGGQVYRVGPDELLENLVDFLHARRIDRLQAWEQVPGLPLAQLAAYGFELGTSFKPGMQAGLTGALAGIAETGSLVIPAGGESRPLTASLLPAIHIAVLPAARILNSLEQVMQLPEVTAAAATVLVTGPSRTGDIEQTITIGMHGPAEVHVFIVDDGPVK